MKFRHEVAQHCSKSDGPGAFDDRLLHLNQSQNRQCYQLFAATVSRDSM